MFPRVSLFSSVLSMSGFGEVIGHPVLYARLLGTLERGERQTASVAGIHGHGFCILSLTYVHI